MLGIHDITCRSGEEIDAIYAAYGHIAHVKMKKTKRATLFASSRRRKKQYIQRSARSSQSHRGYRSRRHYAPHDIHQVTLPIEQMVIKDPGSLAALQQVANACFILSAVGSRNLCVHICASEKFTQSLGVQLGRHPTDCRSGVEPI